MNLCPSPQPAITAMTERPVAGRKQKGRREAGLFADEIRSRSVLRDRRAAPTVVHADGDEIDILADALVAEDPPPSAAAVVKVTVRSCMNRWSYSMPAVQFWAKPYSRPAPTVPPQRVSSKLLVTCVPVGVKVTRK